MMQPGTAISKAERLELAKVIRMRARVAKDATRQRSATLIADFEQQLATEYKIDDAAWRDLTAAAQEAVAAADATLADRCRVAGIPPEFRPTINVSFYSRGENAYKERRAELRKVAQTRVAALERDAAVAIDRQAADLITSLVAGGLESTDAVAFLDRIPKVDELMPQLSMPELKALTGRPVRVD